MPPTITVPADTELEVGETFDPLAGVVATDNADGDVTDRVEVVGTVDTTKPGSYALTYVVADTNGNQVIVPRVVRVVEPVDDRATTSVAASNVAGTFGQPVRLRAQVTPSRRDRDGPVPQRRGRDLRGPGDGRRRRRCTWRRCRRRATTSSPRSTRATRSTHRPSGRSC